MLATIFAGFVIGFFIGATGIGGGALLMPYLLLIGMNPLMAIGTDLTFNFITKGWNLFLHYIKKINFKLFLYFLIGIVAANVIAFFLIRMIHSLVLLYMVISILIAGSIYNIFRYINKKERHMFFNFTTPIAFILFSFVTALLVSLTSIGAGLILTYLLLHFTSLNEKDIVKITILFGFISTFFGALLHAILGNINYKLVTFLILGSFPGSYLGYVFHTRVNYKTLRLVLSFLILFISILIIFQL